MSNSSVCNILDMPDEILVKIILHFDARERLALGNSCQRFNNLVFGDEELLRNLDFASEQKFTTASDIKQYFDNESTCKKILGINAKNVPYYEVRGLRSSIGKAINLVELNILGVLYFHSIDELSCFLKPLAHLKRLSVCWPPSFMEENYHRYQVLEELFSRLTYLLLQSLWYSNKFLHTLQLCQQLEELHLFVANECRYRSRSLQEVKKLSSLKFVRLETVKSLELLKNDLMSIVTDPAEWTDFSQVDSHYGANLERNVEVCAELEQVKKMPLPQRIADFRVPGPIDKGWPLVPEHLLTEVIRVTHEDAPEKFCCLSPSTHSGGRAEPCLLKIDEAKKLLKDSRYQISFLRFLFPIEKNCDVHLLASAFPNLTTLLLYMISKRKSTLVPKNTKALCRRLKKKGSLASEEEHSDATNKDSSFKMLVENTPRLEVLVISPVLVGNDKEYWDLEALDLISGWKNLTIIRLRSIPITDGKFLIDIGRECNKLEEVTLSYLGFELGSNENCCYESELFQMLQHCENLRKLSIEVSRLNVSAMFGILTNCSRLAHFYLETRIEECDPIELTSSLEKMLRQCQQLNRFSMHICSRWFRYKLRPAVERIMSELNRSDFQFDLKEPDWDLESWSDTDSSSSIPDTDDQQFDSS